MRDRIRLMDTQITSALIGAVVGAVLGSVGTAVLVLYRDARKERRGELGVQIGNPG